MKRCTTTILVKKKKYIKRVLFFPLVIKLHDILGNDN